MRNALDLLYRISGALAACSLLAIAVIVFTQVAFNLVDYAAGRLLGRSFGLLIPSYAQLAGYALGFATFLSLGLGFRRAAHIRVTLLERQMSPFLRKRSLFVVAATGVTISGFMLWSFAQLVWESWEWGDRASGLLRTPLWIPQGVMLFGIFVLFVALLDTLIELALTGRSPALEDESSVESTHNE